MAAKITVLIVDDSKTFRSIIEESLFQEKDIQVIGSVRNGVKAIEFLRSFRPDIITLDVEMPQMNGLETLQAIGELQKTNPKWPQIGIIMISSFTRRGADTTVQALESGAFDFITKPVNESPEDSVQILRRQLIVKIRAFATKRHIAQVKSFEKPQFPLSEAPPSQASPQQIQAIVMGLSTGGPKALSKILPVLCQMTNVPILIVQHMPPTFTSSLANRLNQQCTATVQEAKNGDIILKNHVYIAPGGEHMVLRPQEDQSIMIETNHYPPENGCRPSVDVLFRSATSAYGGSVVAVILTGMGTDGVGGIRSLKPAGAYVIAQDEASSIVWGMPGSAVASGYVDAVHTLENIPNAIAQVIQKSKIN